MIFFLILFSLKKNKNKNKWRLQIFFKTIKFSKNKWKVSLAVKWGRKWKMWVHKMATPLRMFRGSNLNSSWGKCGVWLMDQWIPSHCSFIVYLHILRHISVDMMIVLYLYCMSLIIHWILLSCVFVYIFLCLYVSILYDCVLHDYLFSL